jgi:hypothetical protein
MDDNLPQLTPHFIHEISERIRAGAYEQVAAQSLGVALDTYQDWLLQGQQASGPELCRALVMAV